MDENERNNVLAALLVVVLSIAAFVAYFAAGSGIAFWIVAVIAVIAGFYMAYRLSKEERQRKAAAPAQRKGKGI